MEILENFATWKQYVGNKVRLAEKVGFSEDAVAWAVDLAQVFLAKMVTPQNPQEQLLKQLYQLGNDEERLALSHMIVKLVKEEVASDPGVEPETKH